MNSVPSNDDSLVLANQLVDAIRTGDQKGAGSLITALTDARFDALFQEVGKLTRDLHDTIATLATDERLLELAREDMPDARDRLNYVIEKTEEATDRTLSAVEALHPVNDALMDRAEDLRTALEANRDSTTVGITGQTLLAELDRGSQMIRDGLTEITLAQEYQDLTGQVIKRTIKLVGQVEEKLVQLVRTCGELSGDSAVPAVLTPGASHGPAVRPHEQVLARQDEVDELLADLGF